MPELARAEARLRIAAASGTDPEAVEVVRAIVAWRLSRQTRDDAPSP